MIRPRLTFYTNIPTPYQSDFFDALAGYVELTVVYYAATERGRQWTEQPPTSYRTIWLRDSLTARWLQRGLAEYHFSWSIFRTARRDRADYVIVSGGYWMPNSQVALLMARWRRKKTAFFGERLSGTLTGWRGLGKRLLLRSLRHSCTRIFAVGQEAAETYNKFGVTTPKTVVPYVIAPNRFSSRNSCSATGDGRVVLLSVGSLIRRKGMDTLIRAFRRLNSIRYGHVHLRIVGEGPERSALQRLIGEDTRIEMAGFRDADQLPACYAEADAFVLASRDDGWGVVINEAIAAGLPIISSDAVGAARAWVRHGVNGLLCSPDDVDAFAGAMRRLIDDSVLRRQQAQFNRAFRAQTSAAHYAERLYQTILTDLGA